MKRTTSLLLAVALVSFLAAPARHLVAETAGSARPASVPASAVPLTTDSFNMLLKAEQKLAGVVTRDHNLELATAASGNHEAIDSWRRRFEANPNVAEALKSAGISRNAYFGTLLSLLQAKAVSDYRKQDKQAPASLAKMVPSGNLAFVAAHEPEIAAWMRRSGTPQVHPNTIEDMYVASAAPPSPGSTPAAPPSPAGQTPLAKETARASQTSKPEPPASSNP